MNQYVVELKLDDHENGSTSSVNLFYLTDTKKEVSPTKVAEKLREVFRSVWKEISNQDKKDFFVSFFNSQCHELPGEWEVLQENNFHFNPNKNHKLKGWITLNAFEQWISDDPEENWYFQKENMQNGEVREIFNIIFFK